LARGNGAKAIILLGENRHDDQNDDDQSGKAFEKLFDLVTKGFDPAPTDNSRNFLVYKFRHALSPSGLGWVGVGS
jgi:hypothetical protein